MKTMLYPDFNIKGPITNPKHAKIANEILRNVNALARQEPTLMVKALKEIIISLANKPVINSEMHLAGLNKLTKALLDVQHKDFIHRELARAPLSNAIAQLRKIFAPHVH